MSYVFPFLWFCSCHQPCLKAQLHRPLLNGTTTSSLNCPPSRSSTRITFTPKWHLSCELWAYSCGPGLLPHVVLCVLEVSFVSPKTLSSLECRGWVYSTVCQPLRGREGVPRASQMIMPFYSLSLQSSILVASHGTHRHFQVPYDCHWIPVAATDIKIPQVLFFEYEEWLNRFW